MLAFDRRINPFSLVSVNCSNVFFFSLRSFFNTSITLASVDSEILFCNSFISFVNFFSCLLVSFFLYVAYFIVSFLIVPLINSHCVWVCFFVYFSYFSYVFLNCFLIILIQ